MNVDVSLDKIPKGDYLYALNIDNKDGDARNIKGNIRVPLSLPEGMNVAIGKCKDEANRRLYFFVFNTLGNHTINYYDYQTKEAITLINSPLLNFSKKHLILHADIVDGKLLYWVDGLNPARKLNIDKILSNSYFSLTDEILNAYKLPPAMPPSAVYKTDIKKKTNFLRDGLYKFTYRFIFDDGEISNFSDYSKVPYPDLDETNGENPTLNNNVIEVSLETGNEEVKRIELAVQRGGGKFVSVSILSKEDLNIPDNSTYVYRFFNDESRVGLDEAKVARPYNFFPQTPSCQKFVQNAIAYADFFEGFDSVKVDLKSSIVQEDFKYDVEHEQVHNNPSLKVKVIDTFNDGGRLFNSSWRRSRIRVTVGSDVRVGNKFIFKGTNRARINVSIEVTATEFDDSYTIANKIMSLCVKTGNTSRFTPITRESDGTAWFVYDVTDSAQRYFSVTEASAISVLQNLVISDSQKAIRAIKSGSTISYGIVYEREGQKGGVNTSHEWMVRTPFIAESGSLKVTQHLLTINHQPPEWADSFHIVRTKDLLYNNYLQMMVQRAILVKETDKEDYYDLIVGSLATYNEVYKNSILSYEFKKGDRIRLIERQRHGGLTKNRIYAFIELEIINYKDFTETTINREITTKGNNRVTLDMSADKSNIGRTIEINGERREIIEADGQEYVLDSKLTTKESYDSYKLYDFRGTIRVKKPDNMTIDDGSTIEIYSPVSVSDDTARPYYDFGEKYRILNAGTPERSHSGNVQNQEEGIGAVIRIDSGDAYIKPRAMPMTNKVPGVQMSVRFIEDPNFSDFFVSDLSDHGRAYLIDQNPGRKRFSARIRYSGNYISGTQVNGLSDFDNLERLDLNDPYGAIKLLHYQGKRLYVFKELRTGFCDIYATRITDQAGSELLSTSDKLLSQIDYYGWQGGIGDNPESFVSQGFRMYFVSANSGVIIRLSVDGETPISETFMLDTETKRRLEYALLNKTRIHGGFELLRNQYLLKFEQKSNHLDHDNTLAFKEDKKRWTSYFSFAPEMMANFMTDFFTFKNGEMWIHNKNELYNNFYGKQYNSSVKFVANNQASLHKIYYGIKMDSNRKWWVPNMETEKNEKFPNGTKSRLTKNNIIQEDGKYWADILKDMGDPRFSSSLQALFNGREVQGSVLTVTLESDHTSETSLREAFVYTEEVPKNF